MQIKYIVFDIETQRYLNVEAALMDEPFNATLFDSIDLALGTAKAFELSFVEIKTIYKI